MSERTAAASPIHQSFIVEPSSLGGDAARYAFGMMLVATVSIGAAYWTYRTTTPRDEVSEIDSAITIDLLPADASSQLASDAVEGLTQQAAPASVPRAAPQQQTPPKPVGEPKPEDTPKVVEKPPRDVPADLPAVLERKQEQATPPAAVAAPAVPAVEERAPSGSPTPAKGGTNGDEQEHQHASSHAMTLWQKAMMRRLEAAKVSFGSELRVAGTVKVAFEIDAAGALATEHVASSSGSASLDRAAMLLVRQAAPFPAPPPGSSKRDVSFVVPIRFR